MIRPGPSAILPGLAPGGVVVHGYSMPGERLLFVQAIPGRLAGDAESFAERAAELAAVDRDPAVCLVAFDGDTGERFGADDWREP